MAITDRRGVAVSSVDPPIEGDPNPGLAIKAPCLCATTGANIVLSGPQTIDGVSVGSNAERVLVKDQTNPTTNGLYNASSSTWTRTIDAASNDQWASGLQVEVSSGAINGNNVFVCTSPDPIILGASAIQFQGTVTPNIAVEFTADAGPALLTIPMSRFIEVPWHFTIARWTILGDVIGSAVFDVWNAPYGSYPPTVTNSIVGGNPPTLTAAQSAQSSTLTGWSPAIPGGSILGYNLESVSSLHWATLSLYGKRP